MPDNKNKQEVHDDKRIADDELSYWTKKLGATRKQIRDAKKVVGDSVKKVIEYLQKNKKS